MTHYRKLGIGCVLCASLLATAAEAKVTAVYGCRFYVDGKVYAEFRIDEINHTDWADEATFDPPQGKPQKVEVETQGSPFDHDALRFRLPTRDVEIVVANTLNYVNARYSGPTRKNLPGECEQADSSNHLNRWFRERERERKKSGR